MVHFESVQGGSLGCHKVQTTSPVGVVVKLGLEAREVSACCTRRAAGAEDAVASAQITRLVRRLDVTIAAVVADYDVAASATKATRRIRGRTIGIVGVAGPIVAVFPWLLRAVATLGRGTGSPGPVAADGTTGRCRCGAHAAGAQVGCGLRRLSTRLPSPAGSRVGAIRASLLAYG